MVSGPACYPANVLTSAMQTLMCPTLVFVVFKLSSVNFRNKPFMFLGKVTTF